MTSKFTTYVMEMPDDVAKRRKFISKLNDLADKHGVKLVSMSLYDEISWEEHLREELLSEGVYSNTIEHIRSEWEKNQ